MVKSEKIQNVLLIEADQEIVSQIRVALSDADCHLLVAADGIMACIRLLQYEPDFVLLPATQQGFDIRTGLDRLRPGTRFLFLRKDGELVEELKGEGDAEFVHLNRLDSLLEKLVIPIVSIIEEDEEEEKEELFPMDTVQLLLKQLAQKDVIHTVILSHQADLIAYAGDLDDQQAAVTSLFVAESWGEGKHTAQVQFAQLAASMGTLLLYSRLMEKDCLLTILAYPNTLVSQLRRLANKAAQSIELLDQEQLVETVLVGGSEGEIGR